MDRARRLASLWNWLPVFRAVAEVEHLQKAAKSLHISASAVSRTIRLLEDDLGQPLFVRNGRALELTQAGRSFLASVRDAMRRIDDGLGEIVSAPTELRVACAGDHPLSFLCRALAHLQREEPGLVATVTNPPISQVSAMMLRGDLDVAFGVRPERRAGLCVEAVGTLTHGIFCGPSHPLFSLGSITLADVREHAFAAPSLDASHGVTDCWPVDIERRVSVHLPALAPLEMCAAGAVLVVLPDGLPAAEGLRRLPLEVIEPVWLFALRRKPLGDRDSAEALVRAMRREMGKPSPRTADRHHGSSPSHPGARRSPVDRAERRRAPVS